MKKTLLLALLLFSSLASAAPITSVIWFFAEGTDCYTIANIFTNQNLVKTEQNTFTIRVQRAKVGGEVNYTDAATVYATLIAPDETSADYNFVPNNDGSGNQTLNVTMAQIGTYTMVISASIEGCGYTTGRATIYTGRFPIYASIVGATEYQQGDDCKLLVKAENKDKEPILGATGWVTINYPNNSIYVNQSPMIEMDAVNLKGTYYWNASCPSAAGVYTAFINMSAAGSFGTDAKEAWHINEDISTPLTVTITFIFIIILLLVIAAKAAYPWNVLFTGFAGLTFVSFLMVQLSFTGATSFAGHLLELAINLAVTFTPFIIAAVVVKMLWDFSKTRFMK